MSDVTGIVAAGRRRAGVPWPVVAAIAIAWAIAIAATSTGKGAQLHHDALIHSAVPLWIALAIFVLAWQVMVAAMMLPSSIPMVRLFRATSRRQPGHGVAMAAFICGYVTVWMVFGAVAFVGDIVVHRVIDATPWLEARPWIVSAGVLLLAGAFQFSPLMERCLSACRHPASFIVHRYARGSAAAYRLGREHGLFCLGCCGALMLLMFAAGVANLWWMAALAALMAYEKVGKQGEEVGRIAGAALIAGAIVVSLSGASLG
jgi:predicted metal-binding membrane protein